MQSIFYSALLITFCNSPALAAQNSVILESQSKFLLIGHALLGILLLGSMTHNFLLAIRYPFGIFKKIPLEKLYVKVAFVAYCLTFALGALIYPNFRYHVRDQYFDRTMPWASNLFDIKEHWAAIGLALFLVFFLMSHFIDPKKDRHLVFFYSFLSAILTIIVWFSLLAGLILTSYRGI